MPDDKDLIVSICDLHFFRGARPIFRGLNLDIPKGSVTAIMGPSGTGKTTLLKLIGGQLRPTTGQISVMGQNVPSLSMRKLYQLRRRMSVLFQEGALFTDLNVFDNVAFPLREHTNLPFDMLRDLVLMKLEAVGLRGAHRLRVDELSGGMARRVALARAVILSPDLMLYDEPFTGQDPITRGVLVKLIKELNDALGLTSIIVSHDVEETSSIADKVYLLSQGVVVGEGTPQAIFADKTPEVSQFIHGLPDGVVSFHYPARPFREELEL